MNRIRLLIIDDNELDRQLYIRLLSRKYPNTYQFLEASTSEDAIAILNKDNNIDCILLDYNLPDEDGIDVLNEIKSNPNTTTIPVLMLTGQGNENLAVLAIQSGAYNYLAKNNLIALDLHHNINKAVEAGSLKKQEEKSRREIHNLTNNDQLTGLPNRYYFEQSLSNQINRANIDNAGFSILLLDIDDFKKINDAHGHNIGDQLLKEFSRRLATCLRKDDILARSGGDEFAVILGDTNKVHTITIVIKKIMSAFAGVIPIAGNHINIGISIGATCFPKDGSSVVELLKNADLAMNRSKQRGKSCWHFFTQSLQDEFERAVQIEQGLYDALEQDELYMVYQPIYSIPDKSLYGFEALVRWDSKELGSVPPDIFIPLTEESGQIIAIGDWVIKKTIQEFSEWKHKYGDTTSKLSINISPKQIYHNNFIQFLKTVISNANISPEDITLEITETAIMDQEQIIPFIYDLKSSSFNIALDDFCTGYSSLQHLQSFPIDTIKVDNSFIQKIGIETSTDKLINSIISIAENFDLKMIVEGVETKEQLNFLQSKGCKLIQGYYFSKPVSAKDAELIVKKHSDS